MRNGIASFAKFVSVVESADIDAMKSQVPDRSVAVLGLQEALRGTKLFVFDEIMSMNQTARPMPFYLPPFDKTTLMFSIQKTTGEVVPVLAVLITQLVDIEGWSESSDVAIYGFFAIGVDDGNGNFRYDPLEETTYICPAKKVDFESFAEGSKAVSDLFLGDGMLDNIGSEETFSICYLYDNLWKLGSGVKHRENLPLFLIINELLGRCHPQSQYNIVRDITPLARCTQKEKKWRLRYKVLPISSKNYKKSDVVSFPKEKHSPAMHERRGHYRHLQGGKVVWIKSCTVGKIKDGMVIKNYNVTS